MKREKVAADSGMLFHIVEQRRPELAARIKANRRLQTMVVGLGRQGTRHAQLMQEYGTEVTAGVASGKGGTRIHETIPVYENVNDCLAEHPDIVAASIWRHYSTAKEAALEVIEAGVPLVVLITEGIPLRDVRDILVAAKKHNTLLIGGNTPGVIFPPEGIKVGMLPDVFYPEEPEHGRFGPKGVTIISRSGAILYHMSDALASAGIAQNAVLGVGGDGAIGSTFRDLVPMAMEYENTDLVVVAGEIGGIQEELLAKDLKENPSKYPKPLVALISGAKAPEGKTMGHAGAIVAPGQSFGTYESKRDALTDSGVKVVNNQWDLIEAVQAHLGGNKYFETDRYYDRMKEIWDAPPPKPSWGTTVTKVEPNNLLISGYPLQDIIPNKGIVETAHLLVKGEFPTPEELLEDTAVFRTAVTSPPPLVTRLEGEDVSKTIAKALLIDEEVAVYPEDGRKGTIHKAVFTFGRALTSLATILGNGPSYSNLDKKASPGERIRVAIMGQEEGGRNSADMLEAMVVACVDHGVTPPSAQATLIASSTRAATEVAVAHGVGAITDVHGGAGAKAAEFFSKVLKKSDTDGIDLKSATAEVMKSYIDAGKRIEGMGHRVHTKDPRRDVLWDMAVTNTIAGRHVEVSKLVSGVFSDVRGMNLPINVDGVIGAIVADMGLDPSVAKALFILGRVTGLSAHHFEETASQPRMRRINFGEAVYRGRDERSVQ